MVAQSKKRERDLYLPYIDKSLYKILELVSRLSPEEIGPLTHTKIKALLESAKALTSLRDSIVKPDEEPKKLGRRSRMRIVFDEKNKQAGVEIEET